MTVALCTLSPCLSIFADPNGAQTGLPGFSHFRFDDHIASAVERRSAEGNLPTELLTFAFRDDDPGAWTPEDGIQIEKSLRDEGEIVVTAREGGRILSPAGLGIVGNAVSSIQIRLMVSGTDEVVLAWRPAGKIWEPAAHYRFLIRIPKQDEWTTLDIQTRSLQAWSTETIDQLSLELPRGATARFDSFKIKTRASGFVGDGFRQSNFVLANEERVCLSMKTPGYISFDVDVPKGAFLSTGLATVEPNPPVHFQVRARAEGAEETLLEATLSNESQWQDKRISLNVFGGKRVRFTFETSTDNGLNIAIWSNPIVFQTNGASSQELPVLRKKIGRADKVVVYVIDTLRADHLDIYGYDRQTCPNLRELAATGVKFDWFFANDVWTKPSMTSLHVSDDRLVHKMRNYGDVVPDKLTLFPELLRHAGIVTAAISENPHTPPDTASPRSAYSYHYYPNLMIPRSPKRLGSSELSTATFACARRFLESNANRPFYLYIHTVEPHHPYEPPTPFAGKFTSELTDPKEIDYYDEEILWADSNLKAFVDMLREFGIFEDTALFITSDHGEAFREHENMLRHDGKPYNELIRIPLVLSYPNFVDRASVATENAQMLDLAPTILEMFGLPKYGAYTGWDLLPLVRGEEKDVFEKRTIFSYEGFGPVTAAIHGSTKFMMEPDSRLSKLFSLYTDPSESQDLLVLRKVAEDHITKQTAIGNQIGHATSQAPVRLNQDEVEQLRGLGYIQ